ncbi:kinase-like protein [Fomitiporia mediterranea MF3/22]|uniref:kinase-like protein n=1 Tax=Fomitiporia mediterranea (strain MF3/22) TaxID=694068 RepID=UPI0004407E3A|nr:kinase-like protein [Fomitiporia mediterranea MF3/22]EJD00025.1 kinase-like protein [Fomitiporia mediterranea MF3/22]
MDKPPSLDKLKVLALRDDLNAKLHSTWKQPDLSLKLLAPPNGNVGDSLRAGGFGAVYRVQNSLIKKSVKEENGGIKEVAAEFAAKVIWKDWDIVGKPRGDIDRHKEKRKVMIEANNLMELSRKHRHILTCYGVFENEGHWVLVTEYAMLGDLFDYFIANHRKFNEGRIAHYTRQMAKALVFLHKEGFIHRDIKDSPDLSSQREVLVLADLAFLVKKDEDGMAQDDFGTDDYQAPEMFTGTRYTDKMDVWALGVAAYALLFKHILYNAVAEMFKVKRKDVGTAWVARKISDSHRNSKKGLIDRVLDTKIERSIQDYGWEKEKAEMIRSFVRGCLEPDESKRLSAKEALEHPWLNGTDIERGVDWDFKTRDEWRKIAKKGRVAKIREDIQKKFGTIISGEQVPKSASDTAKRQESGRIKKQGQSQMSIHGTAKNDLSEAKGNGTTRGTHADTQAERDKTNKVASVIADWFPLISHGILLEEDLTALLL